MKKKLRKVRLKITDGFSLKTFEMKLDKNKYPLVCFKMYHSFQETHLWVNLVHTTYNAQSLSMERNALMESVPARRVLCLRRICAFMYQIKQTEIV